MGWFGAYKITSKGKTGTLLGIANTKTMKGAACSIGRKKCLPENFRMYKVVLHKKR